MPLAARSGIAIEESPLLQERTFGDLRGVAYAELTEDPFGPTSCHPMVKTGRHFGRASQVHSPPS
jgi:hypothetical protein